MSSENITKEYLLREISAFYEQYVYLKNIILIFNDAESAVKYYYKSKDFFRLVASSCIDSYCMTLARLYEEGGQSKTIRRFIKICKENRHLFNSPDEVMEKLTSFSRNLKKDDLKNAIKVILYRRNKYFAHNDEKAFAKDESNISLGYLPMYQIWTLTRETGRLLRELSRELNYDVDDDYSCNIYNKDLDELIESKYLHRNLDSIM